MPILYGVADKPELYGLAVAVAVTVAALIILTVALVIVIVKCQRRKKIQCVSQGEGKSINHTCIQLEAKPLVLCIFGW